MLSEYSARKKLVGVKQSSKAIRAGLVSEVLFADDADPALLEPVEALCISCGVPVSRGYTLAQLGAFGGISVGASVIAVLKT